MLKDIETIKLDILTKKRNKEFYKYALLVVETYDEFYIIQERTKISENIKKLKACLHPKDYFGIKSMLKSEIRLLNKKIRMFKYLIK